jgi:hypothetical protein
MRTFYEKKKEKSKERLNVWSLSEKISIKIKENSAEKQVFHHSDWHTYSDFRISSFVFL